MASLKDTLDTHFGSRCRNIMQREAPIFAFAVVVVFIDIPVDAVTFSKIAFVVLALMLVGNFLVGMGEKW